MRKIFTLLALMALCNFAFAQVDFSPLPGNTTHCPDEYHTYTATGSGCGSFTWTITKGKIRTPAMDLVTTYVGGTAEVKWDDLAEIGTLKVASTCGGQAKSETKNFSIASLKDQNLFNAKMLTPTATAYCDVQPVTLAVDVIYLNSTNAGSGVSQQRADGYEWTLPSGWNFSGGSSSEIVSIYPNSGCVGGSVTVRAYMNCSSGKKYSNAASISLNRSLTSALGVPSGYTGPKCGVTAGVTFTASALSCATSYRWTATNTGWKDINGNLGAWTTATNSITLIPSGTSSDGGIISVDINLGCNATATQTYTAVYSDNAPPAPSFTTGSTPVTICNNSGTVIEINPVPGISSYAWYADASLLINGQAYSSASPLITSTTSVTVTPVTGYWTPTLYVKSYNGTCAGSTYTAKTINNGIPYFTATFDGTLVNSSCGYSTPFTTGLHTLNVSPNGATGNPSFSLSGPGGGVVTGSSAGQNFTFNAKRSDITFSISYSVSNACGTFQGCTLFCNCASPDVVSPSSQSRSVYPNPADQNVTVESEGISSIGVFNASGNKVKEIAPDQTKSKTEINVNDLPEGDYILKINRGSVIESKRIRVHHH